MSRFTVVWLPGAESELADIWMSSAEPSLIRRAITEVDALLSVDPDRKGVPFALGRLAPETIDVLLTRISPLPESLRQMRLGPLDVYFVPSEPDRRVTVAGRSPLIDQLRASAAGLLFMILADEGLSVRQAKTRFMPAGRRQNVCGLNLNQRLNTTRGAFDQLKAILHRCATKGLTAEESATAASFRDHLRGRITYMASVNPSRGKKLQASFDAIAWQKVMPQQASGRCQPADDSTREKSTVSRNASGG